jgi:hypothetical protein
MEVKNARLNESKGLYLDASRIYLQRIHEKGAPKDHQSFIASSRAYLGQVGNKVSDSASISEKARLDAAVVNAKLGELDDERSSLTELSGMVDSAQQSAIDGGSDTVKAQIGDGYQGLKADIGSAIAAAEKAKGDMTDSLDKIKAIVAAKMALVDGASDGEDYDTVAGIAAEIGKYNLINGDVENIQRSAEHAKKGKQDLSDGKLEEGLAEYQAADGCYHFKVFGPIISGSKDNLAAINYKKGVDLLNGSDKSAEALIKALDYLNKAKSYNDQYRDVDGKIDVAKRKIVNLFVSNAKKYESVGQWGCAALERMQALIYDKSREDQQIDNDLGKLKKSKMLKVALGPSAQSDLSPSTTDFATKARKDVSADGIFADQHWQMVKNEAVAGLMANIEKGDYDLTALTPQDRDQFDLAAFISISSYETDGPNKDEEEMSKSVIVKTHTEANPDHAVWVDKQNDAKRTLQDAQNKQAADTDNTIKNLDAITVALDQATVTAISFQEPDATIQVPDYGDATWQEINWDETASISGQVLCLRLDSKGKIIQSTIPINIKDTETCKEVHGKRYADKAGIVDVPKKLASLSQIKQGVYSDALKKAEGELLATLQKSGFAIMMDRLNNAVSSNSDEAVDDLMYVSLMYPSMADRGKLQSILSGIHQGYQLTVKSGS